LRILALHGYHGSGAILREQMAPLRGALEHVAEFVYVDAPSLAQGDFGWWHAVDRGGIRYQGWPRTRDWIVDLFEREKPFDGVFGFSQGAALTGLLVGLRLPFNFAIVAGGFVADDTSLSDVYGARDAYARPSVHLIGKRDSIITPRDSRELSSRFDNPIVLEHDGGHIVPSAPNVVSGIETFLARARQTAPSLRSR